MKFRWLLLLLIFVAACGPSKTAQELEADQQAATIARRKAQILPHVGFYFGKMLGADGKDVDIYIELFATSQIVLTPTKNEPIEIPTIGGVFGQTKIDPITKKPVPISLRSRFPSGSFDDHSRSVWLHGNAVLDGATDKTGAAISINLELKGHRLTGRYFSPTLITTMTLERAR